MCPCTTRSSCRSYRSFGNALVADGSELGCVIASHPFFRRLVGKPEIKAEPRTRTRKVAVAYHAAVPGVAITDEQRGELVAYHATYNSMKPRTDEQKARTNELQRARRAKNKAEAEKANGAKKKAKK